MSHDPPKYVGSPPEKEGRSLLSFAIALLAGALLLVVYVVTLGPQDVTNEIVVTTVAYVGSPVITGIRVDVVMPTRTVRPTSTPGNTPTPDPYTSCTSATKAGELCRKTKPIVTPVALASPKPTATPAPCSEVAYGVVCRWDGAS